MLTAATAVRYTARPFVVSARGARVAGPVAPGGSTAGRQREYVKLTGGAPSDRHRPPAQVPHRRPLLRVSLTGLLQDAYNCRSRFGPSVGSGSVFENRIASPRRLRKPQSIQGHPWALALLVTGQARRHMGGSKRTACHLGGTPQGEAEDGDSRQFKHPSFLIGEFDPGSERTLAACLTHASRARTEQS